MKGLTKTVGQVAGRTVSQRRLKVLLERYRLACAVQRALLNLSELASTLSDMSEFYPAIHSLLNHYLPADNFYVVLTDHESGQINLEYFADEKDQLNVADLSPADFATGLTGYVVRSRQPLLCDQQRFTELIAQGEIQSQGTPSHHWLGVPLCRGQQLIGVMAVQVYDNSYSYQQRDVDLLEAIAGHTVTAIDRVKSRELLELTVRERTKQLQNINQSLQREIRERSNAEKLQAALYKISELTATNADMQGFYREVHKILSGLMKVDNCYIALLDESGKTLSFPFYLDQYSPPAQERPLRKGFTEYVLRVGEARLINRELSELLVAQGEVLRLVSDPDQQVPLSTSWLGAPLLIDQQALGVIAVQSYDEAYLYSENELNILRFVSQHIAVAIQRKLNAEQQKQHQEELERKIFERTRELRQTNLFLRLQVEERKKIEEKLFHEANHDTLTGLANRQLFMQHLKQQFTLRGREPGLRFALLFIDLDRFKLINDTMGHHAGDCFLVEVSQRLLRTVREHDLVARLGGDEFVVLLTQLNCDTDAEEVADRIIEAVRAPMLLQEQQVHSGASIGIACYKPDYKNADALLRDADAAMYQAKAMGRNRFVIFTSTMRMQLLQELSMEQALHQALADKQFEIAFDPIVCSEKQHLLGFESNIQWVHPDLGVQQNFSHQAQQAGVLAQIELQILQQLLQQLQQQQQPALLSLKLCQQHLINPVHFDRLHKVLLPYQSVLHRLALGFAETDLIRLGSSNLNYLQQLKRLGVRLSLEQFGVEMMPFGLLAQYPFDFVKLDPSFSRSVLRHPHKKQLLELLLNLSQSYKFRVIAAGVDDAELQQQLLELGCCYLQGQLIRNLQQAQASVFLQQLA
ncbi:diguanylate cyclase domain-containing protein [Rheinheimera sp. 4Y26]|uniref:sensor domain-containing phosphodiesterase n=1 Tax=Rheinheimera sp. 4Y26 TaxID=2977811 RepID=UPI0021B0C5DF|nr:diguanylate cyclase [Rheinheimera sp. 4Y26]MCT6698001.1 diguanylate cyclase [Rheinheimera sp. 4Y26]